MKKKLTIGFSIIIAFLLLFLLCYRIPENIFKDSYSRVILDKKGEYIRVFINKDEQWHLPPTDEKVPDKLIKAVLQFEDKDFYKHSGVDLLALMRATYQNVTQKRVVSGASTVTMQVARISKQKKRNIYNKLIEIYQALQIEMRYDKNEIIKMYLDHAPYGGNIIGYKTASKFYFDKMPNRLTWAEAATLAVLPNAPGLIHPKKNPHLLKKKRDKLLKDLFDHKIIDKTTYRLAKMEQIPKKRYKFKNDAPHFSHVVLQKSKKNIIKTTLDLKLHNKIKRLALQYITNYYDNDINNLSIIVVDNKNYKIKSYIGSQDYFDQKRDGMVDGLRALRSPGSTLKPFLYAMAMDKGLLIPDSLLKDIPIYYGNFSPKNADKQHRGLVKAKDALIKSLNIPVVNLLREFGLHRFYDGLKDMGLESYNLDVDRYGLSLILGTAELKAINLAKLYAGLANYGEFKDLAFLDNKVYKKKKRLLSKGSSYLTLNILKDLNRPGNEAFWKEFTGQTEIAWKTGTSYGRRDAWAVGVTPEWTVLVWVGNFSGRGNHKLSGARMAAPLMFKIFDNLTIKEQNFIKPELAFREVYVDNLTGYRLQEKKGNMLKREMPIDAKPLKISPYYKYRFVEKGKTDYEYCSLCWNGIEIEKKLMLEYPVDVINYISKKSIVSGLPIKHNPKCPSIKNNSRLKILYPRDGISIFLPKDFGGEDQKLNIKVARDDKSLNLYWYINGKFITTLTDGDELAMSLIKGRNSIKVIDSNGNFDKVTVFID